MGLKEERKKIQREIEHFAKNAPADKVRKELTCLANTIEDLLNTLAEVQEAESNIP